MQDQKQNIEIEFENWKWQKHTRVVIVEVWPHHKRTNGTRHALCSIHLIRCLLGAVIVLVHVQLNGDNIVHCLN